MHTIAKEKIMHKLGFHFVLWICLRHDMKLHSQFASLDQDIPAELGDQAL